MSQVYSFRDPVTQELKSWGYVETNEPGDIRQAEAWDFNLDRRKGRWRWDGVQWVVYVPPVVISDLAKALDAAIAGAAPTLVQLKTVLQEWRKQVS